MQRLALAAARGHPFVMIGGERCVVDTGSPICFRRRTALTLDCQRSPVVAGYFGLDRAALTRLIGAPLIGLIAGDILGTLDTEFDSAKGALTASRERLVRGDDPRSSAWEHGCCSSTGSNCSTHSC